MTAIFQRQVVDCTRAGSLPAWLPLQATIADIAREEVRSAGIQRMAALGLTWSVRSGTVADARAAPGVTGRSMTSE